MAYSNWGAFVYKNGERQENREDVPVFGDADVEAAGSAVRIFVNLLKLREQHGDKYEDWQRCQHAVLGSGAIRLCGYKSYPKLFRATENGAEVIDIDQFKTDKDNHDWNWYDGGEIAGEIDGCKFRATRCEDPEAVELELVEPDGTVWTGKSGIYMGAGYE